MMNWDLIQNSQLKNIESGIQSVLFRAATPVFSKELGQAYQYEICMADMGLQGRMNYPFVHEMIAKVIGPSVTTKGLVYFVYANFEHDSMILDIRQDYFQQLASQGKVNGQVNAPLQAKPQYILHQQQGSISSVMTLEQLVQDTMDGVEKNPGVSSDHMEVDDERLSHKFKSQNKGFHF